MKFECAFLLGSGTYLGHIIDREGIHVIKENVEAIALTTVL